MESLSSRWESTVQIDSIKTHPPQSLVSANSHGSSFQYLALSTVGILFLGTPHRGTQAAKWGQIVATTAKALGFGFEDSILNDLRLHSEHSKDLVYEFTLWANRASITLICFFEQHQTDVGRRFGMTWRELVRQLGCKFFAISLT